jgi:predicted transcriptional regulator
VDVDFVRETLRRMSAAPSNPTRLAALMNVPHMTLRRFLDGRHTQPDMLARMTAYVRRLQPPTEAEAAGMLRVVEAMRLHLAEIEQQARAAVGDEEKVRALLDRALTPPESEARPASAPKARRRAKG